MDDPGRSPKTDGDAAGGTDKRRPRWGLVVAIVIVAAVLGLMVYLHLTGTLGPGVH
jgi:hypothetical protein